MLDRFHLTQKYPRQFWFLFWGLLISTIGASMIWPFLMIYVSERLHLPLIQVAGLATLNAVMGLVASFIAGPITDRAGRKWVMALSLVANGVCYVFMDRASSLPAFALLMGLRGFFAPFYTVGADAMLTDLIPAQQRTDAYALLRLSDNVGVALGPAIGGFVASASYSIAFYLAAIGMVAYGLLMAFFAAETLPHQPASFKFHVNDFAGYGRVLKDKSFARFSVGFTLFQICATMLWVLLAVYVKQNYQVPESQYGLILATNASMVVLFQIAVTTITRRYPPLRVLAVGALIYAIGVGSVAMGQGFWGFWISFVVVTIGELMLMPTASAYAASLAQPDMRGRYLSIYSLTRGVGAGIAPVLGGWLNDSFGPKAIWYGGAMIGLLGALNFAWMARREKS